MKTKEAKIFIIAILLVGASGFLLWRYRVMFPSGKDGVSSTVRQEEPVHFNQDPTYAMISGKIIAVKDGSVLVLRVIQDEIRTDYPYSEISEIEIAVDSSRTSAFSLITPKPGKSASDEPEQESVSLMEVRPERFVKVFVKKENPLIALSIEIQPEEALSENENR